MPTASLPAPVTADGTSRRAAFGAADVAMLLAISATAGAGAWVLAGRYVSRPAPLLFDFEPAPAWWLALAVAGALTLLAAVQAVLRRAGDPAAADPGLLPRHGHAAPLALLGLLLVPPALHLLRVPVSRPAIVLLYLLADLRWWVAVVAVAWFIVSIAARLVRGVFVPPHLSRPAAHAALVLVAVGASLATSPDRRFHSVIVGDEPRYLRYAESFYQGHGLDISAMVPFSRFTPGSSDRGAQLEALVKGLGVAMRDAGRDAVLWIGGRHVSWTPGAPSRNSFVKGRDGGVYQLHMPGLAVLLYPAYYADRVFLSPVSGRGDELPEVMLATGLALLALYALLGVVTFDFLLRWTDRPWLSWSLAALMLLTIPVAPFSLQYYPEIAGGIALVWLVRAYAFDRGAGAAAAGALGAIAGFLPWLHMRFLPLAAIVILAHAWRLRRRHSSLVALALGAGAFAVPLAAYSYHVSGSVLPTAMYALSAHGRVDLAGVPNGVAGLLLDRRFGVLPFAPVFIVALLGLPGVLRERIREAWLPLLLALVLAVLSASHVPWTGASSPARFLVAVMPFALLPMAHAIERHRRSPWFVLALAVLAILAVDNAAAFLSHMADRNMRLTDEGVSGWKTVLVFPTFTGRGRADAWPKAAQVTMWLVALAAIVLIGWKLPQPDRGVTARRWSPWRWCAGACVVLLVTALAGGWLTQARDGFERELRTSPRENPPASPTRAPAPPAMGPLVQWRSATPEGWPSGRWRRS